MSVILASASPRRQELLRFITKDFLILPADIDETLPDNISADYSSQYLAEKKAEHISITYPDDTVIGCDTVVVLDDTIMGKPTNKEDAYKMLSALSGKVHKVITGVCISKGDKKVSFAETTEVEFCKLTDNDIESYIATGDPMDKAGAYGIQTEGCLLVKKINGDFFNVVGLPVSRLSRELKNFL